MKRMRTLFTMLFVLCLIVPVLADDAAQTDWSGGDGVAGPVTDWADEFDSSTDINWSGASGEFTLDRAPLNSPVEHLVDSSFDGAISVYSADLDGDLDILGAAASADDITWWENDGSGGGWTSHDVVAFDGPNYACAADLDGDGDTDVLVAHLQHSRVAWWENTDGSGTSWTEHCVEDYFQSAECAYPVDIDGDGTKDILSVAFDADYVTWWKATEFNTTSGELTSSILDTNTMPEWGQISWTADTPTDTTLVVEVRASNDSSSMGSWSAVSSGDDLGSYLSDYDSYFRYKVALSTTDSSASPTFEDISISFVCTAVESVDLFANSRDDGVLLSWFIIGNAPATVTVLRSVNENQPIALSGGLSGSARSWLDVSGSAGVEYAYYLQVTEIDGTVSRFGPSVVVVPGMVSELTLSDPYPNPASSALTISYELATYGAVSLSVYDLSGRLVGTLVSGEQTAGRHSVSWDSSAEATGVYLLRLEANGETMTKRAVISR